MALKQLLAVGGISLGAGALGKGLLNLNEQFAPAEFDPLMHTGPVSTPLPVPINAPKKKRENPQGLKIAEADPLQPVADAIAPTSLGGQAGMPMAVGTSAAGLYGGWKLMDWLTRRDRKNQITDETDSAQKEYQQALAHQYQMAMQAKHAGDDLGIDGLFEKCALDWNEPFKWANRLEDLAWGTPTLLAGNAATDNARGAVNTAALAAMGGTGLATYNWMKSRDKQKVLDKAIQMRARQRQFSPVPFYATTTPAETPEGLHAAS